MHASHLYGESRTLTPSQVGGGRSRVVKVPDLTLLLKPGNMLRQQALSSRLQPGT